MKNIAISLLLFFTCYQTGAQVSPAPANQFSAAINAQATVMGKALLAKDFASFMNFSYPKIVELMGGSEQMVAFLEKGASQMEASGYKMQSVRFGEPVTVVTEQDELQSVLPQTIELKVPGGRLVTESTLIAISNDNGKSWHFIDTSGKDIQTLRAALPNLSTALVIPETKEPAFYKD